MSRLSAGIEPFMLPARQGYRFCIYHRAAHGSTLRGSILYAHPFAEEMNKSRRAVALACRRLAAAGWNVLQIDLLGCGDSSGDFADATWRDWQDDLRLAAGWIEHRAAPVTVLWGLRMGALLAASVAGSIEGHPDLLFWQPVSSGELHLTQFLRLKAAEEMLSQRGDRSTTSRLREQLAAGRSVQVGGYSLTPALAKDFESARLALPKGYPGRVLWLETGSDDAALSPVSSKIVRELEACGTKLRAQAIAGPAFWQTVEIEECSALIQATVDALAL